MTPEQIEKECDALIENFDKEIKDADIFDDALFCATKCAILHQTGIVETWDSIEHEVGLGNYILKKKTEAKQILETLKSRLK
jgi:hypothetical protein